MTLKPGKKLLVRLKALLLSFVMLVSLMPLAVRASGPVNQTVNPDIERTLALSYKLKGSADYINLTSPYTIDDITKVEGFHAKYTFQLKDNIDDTTGQPNRTMSEGDYYLIGLPQELTVSDAVYGQILGNGGRPIVNYSLIEESPGNRQIKMEFTDYVDDLSEFEIYGELEFNFVVDIGSIGEGSTETIYIPIDSGNGIEIEVTNPEPPPTKPISLTKSVKGYSDLTRELVWNVRMEPETGIFSGCVFTDTIDVARLELMSVKHGTVTLTEGSDYTYDPSTGKITYTIPEGRNGTSYQNIEITTTVKPSVYEKLTPTTVNNQANLSGGENHVDIDSNSSSHTVTPAWFKKAGSRIDGNKIMWTLTANTTRQRMYNAVITEYLQKDVVLKRDTLKLGNTQIPVYDDAHTPADAAEVYAVYKGNPDGSAMLKIYLPRGAANASNAIRTVTFVTDVKPPDSTAGGDPVYNNSAELDANYIGDGDGEGTLPTVNIGVVGVGVPHISVVKGHHALTAEDKRNGTITWTIAAASNLLAYGKSTLVDTLPADQDYIPGEIYWGSTPINGTTEPSAVISTDGRTLTITFNTTPEALKTQQTFTVKTKIKPEVYGQNLSSRPFTNQVRAALFSVDGTTELDHDTDTDSISITNTVIAKSSAAYNQNTTGQGINPRVNFTITINSNLMPLKDVMVTDNFANMATEFKKRDENVWNTVSGVKWTYVPGTLVIANATPAADRRDSLDLAAITAGAAYINDILTVNFGSGVAVNDKYTITFTAELAVSQNEIFKQNGTIRTRGNIAGIEADGLKAGVIGTPATGSPEVRNDVLDKAGTLKQAEQQVVWRFRLNQHRVMLDYPPDNPLQNPRVIDILPLGLTLDPTSIKLYTDVIGTNGEFIADSAVETAGTPVAFAYTYVPAAEPGMEGRYMLTVDLPDNQTDYILRFATDVDRSLFGQNITNSAYYAGDTSSSGNTGSATMTIFSSSSGGSTTKASVTVYKKSKDTGALVDTATFALHWLRNGNEPVFVRALSTSGGSVTFYGLTKGEKYTVTEITAPTGYELDNPNPVEIAVPPHGSGSPAPVEFYDTPRKEGRWSPAAVKKLDGKSIIHPFTFEISDGTTALMTGTTQTALPNGDYTVAFTLNSGVNEEDVLSFSDKHIFAGTDPDGMEHPAGSKTFYMKEIKPFLPGYGFDSRVYTLVVKAYNVKGQNALKLVIEDEAGQVLSDGAGNFLPDKIPVFSNTYRADGSIGLSAEKTVTGHALEAGQFTFELYEGSTLFQTVTNGAGTPAGTDTYTGNINFAAIAYTQADVGIKTYRIVEKNTGLSGYTYDTAEYTVTVRIDDNDDGTLESTIQSIQKKVGAATAPASKVKFNNIYTASGVDVNLTASKTLNGRAMANGQFSFKLTQVDASGNPVQEMGTAANSGGNISLPPLSFTQSDIGKTYYYQVSEVDGGQPGYTYDDAVYTVKIDITDNHNGTIAAAQTVTKSGQPAASIAFANSYHASGKITVAAAKTLTGKALPDSQFGFALQQFDNLTGDAMGTASVARNAANGQVIFPELSFTQDDAGKTFHYRITEVNEGMGGYTYDNTAYTVTLAVTDNGDGTLDIQQQITAPAGKTEIVFANSYTASDTFAQLTANKILNGRVLENQQFTFVLSRVDETGTFLEEIQRLKNSADGTVTFDNLTYTQTDMGKTYYYTISEAQDGNPGYGYDATVYTVKVEVTDNNDGTLTADKTILKGADAVLSAIFTNSYTTTGTTVQIAAEKTLTGRQLTDGQFKYSLTLKGNGAQPDTRIEEITNSADGTIRFSPITYTQSDMGKTFIYEVKEINDGKPGYEYDNTVYTVVVKVIDNGDGTLHNETSVTKPGGGNEAVPVGTLVFSNVYTAKGSVQFNARKELVGRRLSDKQFAFVLADKDGNILQTAYNNADGDIRFDAIFFNQDQLGEYQYKVYEVPEGQQNYAYDKTVHFITVAVTDNGDGTLKTAVSIQKEDQGTKTNTADIRFVNRYLAPIILPGPGGGDQTPDDPSTTVDGDQTPGNPATPDTGGQTPGSPSTPDTGGQTPGNPPAPKTGDHFSWLWYALAAASLLLLPVAVRRKKTT